MKYKCLNCGKEVNIDSLNRKIRCPYCGGRILYKPKVIITHFKAR